MRKTLLLIFLVCFAPHAGLCEETDAKVELLAGQIWTYDTRPHESGSLVHIVRVDRVDSVPPVFHILLDNLTLQTAAGSQQLIPHLAVWEKSLRQSVGHRVDGEAEVTPEFSEGYMAWNESVSDGSGGAFSLPLKNILDLLEKAAADGNDVE